MLCSIFGLFLVRSEKMIKSKKDMMIQVNNEKEAENLKNIFFADGTQVIESVKNRFQKIQKLTWSEIEDDINNRRQ